jgi:nitrogen regulatory protein PII
MDKGETIMPVPGGEITTSEILVPKVEEVVEVSTTEEDEDDLPELP